MEWTDDALVLSARPHGETAAIVSLLTPDHGCYAGLVAGGQGRAARPVLQTGNHVRARWRARLSDQLGHFTLDLVTPFAAAWLDHPLALATMASAAAVAEASLPERQSVRGVYEGLLALFALPDPDLWAPAYILWEIRLLEALGYGLDLTRCAISGATDGLTHVSPRTGRAVTRDAGAPWQDKLLPLPGFLVGAAVEGVDSIIAGLDLTAHFLATHIFREPHNRRLIAIPGDLPAARHRLADLHRAALDDRKTA